MLRLIAMLALAPAPQQDPNQPNLLGMACALFPDAVTAADNDIPNYRAGVTKRAGANTTVPGPHEVTSGRPDFRITPWALEGVDIDAESVNNTFNSIDKDPPYNATGAQGWGALVFTLGRDVNTYGTLSGALGDELASGSIPGDIWQFVFRDSVQLPPPIRDITLKAVDSSQIRLVNETAAPVHVALDPVLQWNVSSDSPAEQVAYEFDAVLFSVDGQTTRKNAQQELEPVPPSWLKRKNSTESLPFSGALVFRCDWTLSGGWGNPYVYLTPDELNPGPHPSNPDPTEVTALSWDKRPQREAPENLIYHADNQPDSFMLKIITPQQLDPFVLMRDDGLVPVSSTMGISSTPPTLITGMAGIDPRLRGLEFMLGSPVGPASADICSVYRTGVAGARSHLTVFKVPETVGTGSLEAFLRVTSEPSGPPSTWTILPMGATYGGDLIQYSVPVSSSIQGLARLISAEVVDFGTSPAIVKMETAWTKIRY